MSKKKPLDLLYGSKGLAANAHMVWQIEPTDDQGHFVLQMTKGRTIPQPWPRFEFWHESWDQNADLPIAVIGEPSKISIEDLLAERRGNELPPKLREGVAWFQKYLAEGPRDALPDEPATYETIGIKRPTFKEAKKVAKVKSRPKAEGRGYEWYFEESESHSPTPTVTVTPVTPTASVVLHHGLSPAELKRYPDRHFDCIISDPPWYGQKIFGTASTLSQEATSDEFIANLVTNYSECARVLEDRGTLWVIIKDVLIDKEWENIPFKLAERMKGIGLKFRHKYTWDKSSGLSSAKDRLRDTDVSMLGFVKQDDYHFNDKVIRIVYADGKRLPHPDKVKQGVMANHLMTEDMKAKACAAIDERAYAGQDYRIRKLGDKPDRRDSLKNPDGRERALATDGFYFYDYNIDGAMPKSVLRFPPAPSDPVHSCPLPVELCEWLINSSCSEGGRVLDCYAGVGTTAIAAGQQEGHRSGPRRTRREVREAHRRTAG